MTYALITGASKGIGKAIASEMASRGFNLLLVARSEELLRQASIEIKNRYPVQVEYLVTDLAVPGAAHTVLEWCLSNHFTVSALVNNAGYGLSGHFDNYSLQEHSQMLQVNINTLVELTYLFLPYFKKQQRSYILNISSTSAYQAVPYMSLYSASKSFVLQFSRGLHYELKGSAVSVTCVSPGATDTDFVQRAQIGEKGLKAAAKFNMTPADVAKVAVNGMLKGKTEVIVGFTNKLGAFFAWLLPKKLVETSVAKIYK